MESGSSGAKVRVTNKILREEFYAEGAMFREWEGTWSFYLKTFSAAALALFTAS
jgi:hypothetical protein